FIFNHRLFLLLAKPFMVIALWFGKASFVHVRAPRGVCKQKNPPPITRKRAIILKWLVDFRSMMNVLDMWSSYFGSPITRFRLYMSYQTAVHSLMIIAVILLRDKKCSLIHRVELFRFAKFVGRVELE